MFGSLLMIYVIWFARGRPLSPANRQPYIVYQPGYFDKSPGQKVSKAVQKKLQKMFCIGGVKGVQLGWMKFPFIHL
jgi:hypothetical protein